MRFVEAEELGRSSIDDVRPEGEAVQVFAYKRGQINKVQTISKIQILLKLFIKL